jgi:hypothetical protein
VSDRDTEQQGGQVEQQGGQVEQQGGQVEQQRGPAALMDYPNLQVLGLPPPWTFSNQTPPPAGRQAAQQQDAGGESKPESDDGLDVMSKEQLIDYARERGISPANRDMSKAEIRASIDEAEG